MKQLGNLARDDEEVMFLRQFYDLSAALLRLPDGAREVLLLHDVHGYRHAEIAEQLGLAVGTTKTQLHRARKRLREVLSR